MTHRIATGETPFVGMRVFDNNLDRGIIVEIGEGDACGHYCEAWHVVVIDTDYRGNSVTPHMVIMNCPRLATHFEGERA